MIKLIEKSSDRADCIERRKLKENSKLRDFNKYDYYEYSGAEKFEDGSEPLIYSTDYLDLVIAKNGNFVSMDIYSDDGDFFRTFSNKESAVSYFDFIANYLDDIESSEDLYEFSDENEFKSYYDR